MRRTGRKLIATLGFTDVFWCAFLGIAILVCILWIYQTRFMNKQPEVAVSINIKEEKVSLNGIKESSFSVMCAHQKELVEGHDYLIFYPVNGNMLNGDFVHDPECKKCKKD